MHVIVSRDQSISCMMFECKITNDKQLTTIMNEWSVKQQLELLPALKPGRFTKTLRR